MITHAPALADLLNATPEPLAFPRRAVLAMPAQSARLRAARRWTADLLRRWAVPPDTCDSVVLIVDEFATNAALHGRSDMTLFLAFDCAVLRIAVTDSGPVVQRCKTDAAPDEHGRGLEIVRALAHWSGIHQTAYGCRARAVVRLGVPKPRS